MEEIRRTSIELSVKHATLFRILSDQTVVLRVIIYFL